MSVRETATSGDAHRRAADQLARSEALDASIAAGDYDSAVIGLVGSRRREVRRSRIMAISLVLDIALSLGLGYEYHQLISARHDAKVVCEATNEARKGNRQLWDTLLPVVEHTSQPNVIVQHFKRYVDALFVQQNCAHPERPIPLPPFP